jgi:hypothetical protein
MIPAMIPELPLRFLRASTGVAGLIFLKHGVMSGLQILESDSGTWNSTYLDLLIACAAFLLFGALRDWINTRQMRRDGAVLLPRWNHL